MLNGCVLHTGNKEKCNQDKLHLLSYFKEFYVILKVCGSGIYWAETGKLTPVSFTYTLSEKHSLNHIPFACLLLCLEFETRVIEMF